jgi:hypothetical protein
MTYVTKEHPEHEKGHDKNVSGLESQSQRHPGASQSPNFVWTPIKDFAAKALVLQMSACRLKCVPNGLAERSSAKIDRVIPSSIRPCACSARDIRD